MIGGDRLPPHDIDAEEAVIGSLLIDGSFVYRIADYLFPSDFYGESPRWLYDACIELYKRDEAINQITLSQELSRKDRLEAAGGVAYLNHLIAITPTPMDINHYAQIVYRLAVMRGLIDAGRKISAIGYESDPDVENSMSQAESTLFQLRRGGSAHDLTSIRQALDKYFETPAADDEDATPALPYIASEYDGLDDLLSGGFQRSDMVVVAGRPSMGKTSLALNIARNAAVENKACVAIFSLEMSCESLVMRLLSSEAGVNTRRVRVGANHTEDEEQRIMEACGILAEAPIYIDDTPMMRVSEIRGKALRLSFQRGVDLIIVDYMQLLGGEGRGENRVQEIGNISRALKGLARELNVPVIAVSQLSRASEWRSSHEPQLSDLRESGSIEQDADVVVFIYREEYYNPNEEEWVIQNPDREYPRGEADVIIAKHRNGPTGRIKLKFRHEFTRFDNLGTASEPKRMI
ncbi:replicative DNA helicase [Chloroflexota bacterium]